MLFFTTGDLTTEGTDKNPPMSQQGKKAFLTAIHGGMGFVGVHAAADTFHTEPDPKDNSTGTSRTARSPILIYVCWAGNLSLTAALPACKTLNSSSMIRSFPALEGVSSPVTFNDEWYSLKDFRTDLHVIYDPRHQGNDRRTVRAARLIR